MLNRQLDAESLLQGYDAVSTLYAYIPPLSHWRAWEYAAYGNYHLDGRVLDLGCGDGRYFRLIWPEVKDVIGVDMNPDAVAQGRASGVYSIVHEAPAHCIPEPDGCFDHVFANCSLEHMDHLDTVLAEVARCLKPGGTLLCSVVTDRFIEWSLLPRMVSLAGFEEAASALHGDFMDFHHLVNPLPVAAWAESFARAGLIPEEHTPILPRYNSGAFLLMDSLWHVKKAGGGEMGDRIHPFLAGNPNFPRGFRTVLAGLLEMETDWLDASGAVFLVRKPG